MSGQIDEAEVARIAAGLSRSGALVVRSGIVWSGAQRNQLIAKALAPETCRGAPPLPRNGRWEAPRYALPLTPLGLAVRKHLEAQR